MVGHRMFQSQAFDMQLVNSVIENNMLIDYSLGHHEVAAEFVERHAEFRSRLASIRRLLVGASNQGDVARDKTLLMTVVMLTGECSANCSACYTDRVVREHRLSRDEICAVISQSRSLGSRLVYVPGEGEPMLDAGFWDVVRHAASLGMESVVFTNGILLSKDSEALNRWGMTAREMVRRLSENSVSVYHKLWSLDPKKTAAMMGVDPSVYDWGKLETSLGTFAVPQGLMLLLEGMPKSRVGVQVMVQRSNAEEVRERIIPLIEALGIRSYIELPLHSGRNLGSRKCDPLPEEMDGLRPWLARTDCRRVAYKVVVHNDGVVSPGMAFRPTDLLSDVDAGSRYSIRANDGAVRDLFSLLHSDPFLVWCRYQIDGCLCQRVNHYLSGDDTKFSLPSWLAHCSGTGQPQSFEPDISPITTHPRP